MATIQRNVKIYGTRAFVSEVSAAPANYAPILSNEVDADLDTIYAAWNGGADTVNLKDGSITYAKLAPDAQLWRDAGGSLVPGPNFATNNVVIGGILFAGGAAPLVGKLSTLGGTDGRVILSANDPYAPGDATKASWVLYMDPAGADYTFIGRRASNAATGAVTPILQCNANGKVSCTLADSSVTKPMMAPGSTAFRTSTGTTFRYTANTNITSTTGVAILRSALTTSGGTVLVVVSAAGKFYPVNTGSQIMFYRLTRDGGALQDFFIEAEIPAGSLTHGFPASMNITYVDASPPAAGLHTYELLAFVGAAGNVYHTGLYTPGELYTYEFL